MADKKVNELSTATPALTDYFMGIGSSSEYKALLSALAKKIVEDYNGTTIGGSSQSVKSAVDKAIPAPSSPSSGQFLVYNGSAWVAQSLSTWSGGNY